MQRLRGSERCHQGGFRWGAWVRSFRSLLLLLCSNNPAPETKQKRWVSGRANRNRNNRTGEISRIAGEATKTRSSRKAKRIVGKQVLQCSHRVAWWTVGCVKRQGCLGQIRRRRILNDLPTEKWICVCYDLLLWFIVMGTELSKRFPGETKRKYNHDKAT